MVSMSETVGLQAAVWLVASVVVPSDKAFGVIKLAGLTAFQV